MKRKFLNSVLPAFALALGVAGAFAAQSASKVVSSKTGYITVLAPCDQNRQCDTEGSVACSIRISGVDHTAYGKLLPSSNCTQPLFMPPVNP
ncbi:MAG: hypothetical protein EOO51_13250 [Flavobacterium sp.]|nr:MAG: hypothetical protein EOO51_13250 [Flavobacterium sp.]